LDIIEQFFWKKRRLIAGFLKRKIFFTCPEIGEKYFSVEKNLTV
jgi:hypothetical protein